MAEGAGGPRPEAPPDAAGAELGPLQLARILWAGRGRISVFLAVALLGGVFAAFNTPPVYQADALLELEERGGALALPEGLGDLVEDSPRSDAQIRILRSRKVLGEAVARLDLDRRVKPVTAPLIGTLVARHPLPLPETGILARYARPGETIALDALQVPPRWLGTPMRLVVTAPGRYRLTTPDGAQHAGRAGETLRPGPAGLALRVGAIAAPAGRAYEITQVPELAAIEAIARRLSVTEAGRGSGILELRFRAPERRRAERVLDAITEAYLRQNVARSAAEAENSLEFIERQLPESEAALRAAEAALNRYRQRRQSVDLSLETETLLTQITRLEAELRGLETREDEVSRRYTENHPTYQQLLARKARLEEKLTALRAEADALPETQREVLNLTREVELRQEIHGRLQSRAQEMRVLRASTVGNVRILDTARTAPEPVAPRRALIVGVALLLGGVAGAGAVLLRHRLRRGVQGGEEIEAAGLSVFATIGHSPATARPAREGGEILALSHPDDPAVEAVRSLRTGLHFGMLDAATASLAVTSAAPGAGKSFVATNLAAVAAQAGQRVCLIDADLRRGRLRRLFSVGGGVPGLSDHLAGEAALDAVLAPTELPGLTHIPAGRRPPNPSELLMRPALAELLSALDARFDLVLLDCPPVLAVTDPVIVARNAGATIAVLRHDVTPMAEIRAMQRTMETAGITLAGAVLNAFDPAKSTSAETYSYNYRYDYRPDTT